MPKEAVLDIRVPFSKKRQEWTTRTQVVGWDSALNVRYAEALTAELEASAADFSDVSIKAVRIGGGQAGHLGGENLWTVVRAARELYGISSDVPVSLRCAVSNFSGASMPLFRRCGITRFDLEVLSLSTTAFNRLNFTDPFAFYRVVCNDFLHSYANDSLGIVLLVGHPDASDIEVRRSFLDVRHHNVSRVIIEPYRGPHADPARCERQRADNAALLASLGFIEYAPLRFARPCCEDPFFQMKQSGANVIGIGLGAVTRFDGAETENTSVLDSYLKFSGDFARITVRADKVEVTNQYSMPGRAATPCS
jgi:oxygen-independent coproporphyrinogen-3 oxidase